MPGNCGCIINGQYDVAEIDEDEDWRYYKILAIAAHFRTPANII